MSSFYPNSVTPFRAPSVVSPEMDHAQTRLEQSQRTFSQTQQELHQAMRFRASTPMSAVETSAKDHEIANLQSQLSRQHAEMEQLRTTIERQKTTIKTQSETIANPKQHFPTPPGNNQMPGNQYGPPHLGLPPPPPPLFRDSGFKTTPDRASPIPPSGPPPHQRQQSSPFVDLRHQLPPRPPHTLGQQQDPLVPPQPTPSRMSRNVNEFGSPEVLMHGFGNMGLSNTPRGSSRGSAPTPTSSGGRHVRNNTSMMSQVPVPPSVPYFHTGNAMAMVQSGDGFAQHEMDRKFGDFIHMAEMYAYSHVNTPSTHRDNAMAQELKQRLMNAASTTTAFQFMQTPFTRYQLVCKLMLQYCFKVIFRHDTFAGFDHEADQIIKSCKEQIYQCEYDQQTPSLRRRLIRSSSNPCTDQIPASCHHCGSDQEDQIEPGLPSVHPQPRTQPR